MHVITHQPEDPIGYFHEEITKIKKEMEELNVRKSDIIIAIVVARKICLVLQVDIESTTFLTALRSPDHRTT